MSRTSARAAMPYGVLVGAVVALVPWFSQPGRLVADTKLDLTVDPWGYLGRAGTAWDSHAFFGQLQNQAYGYLFPMGPFFGVGDSLGIPGWIVQRAWWSVVLLTAFVGMYLLVRRWGVGGPLAATVAALLYALSPRALTVLGPISIEEWPSAVAPWIVLASMRLVTSHGRARIGAFALVALACACVGGVNATASLAAFAVAGLYMLTGRAERRLLPLWCAAVMTGTLWWAVPLVVLGRYAYPFLDFIETAAITTSVTSVPNVLRGASHWVGYVGNGQAGGEWPAGGELAYDRWLVVATTAVAVVAVVALARRDLWPGAQRAQRFALVSLLVGVTALCAGFGGNLGLPFTGPWSLQLRELLDGPLAALRNIHKLDPLVRLPVCLGMAAAVQALSARTTSRGAVRVWAVALAVTVVAAISPAIGSSLAPRGSYEAIPARWSDAAAHVDALAQRDGGATLVAPSTRFGEFRWGNTQGDPLEALATSPVVKRDAIPLGNTGAIRVMDALDGALRSGAARPGLVDLLDRMGIGRVLVSHDDLQDAADRDGAPEVLGADDRVESILQRSGLTLVRAWGKDEERISLWSTGRRVEQAEVLDAASAVGLTGGPEALVSLSAHGMLGPAAPAYVLGRTTGVDIASVLQTDTLRRRSLDVASTVENQYSATLAADRPRRRADFPPAESLPGTTRTYAGLRDVRASSSSADPSLLGYRSPAVGVAAAFDGDDDTAWLAAPDDDDPRVAFTVPDNAKVGRVTVRLADFVTAGTVRAVELVVDGRVTRHEVLDQSETVTFTVGRAVQRLEVALVPGPGAPRLAVGISSLGVEGVDTAAELRLPATNVSTSALVVGRDPWSSDASTGRRDDSRVLDRVLTTDRELGVGQVLVRTRTTPQVEGLIDGWEVTGPRVDQDMRTRPGAALDDDPRTRWTVGYQSPDPTLRIDLGSRRTLTGLSLARVAKSDPTIRTVRVRDIDTGEQRVWTRTAPGFTALTARRVAITFDLPAKVVFPVRMPDVTLTGAEDAPAADPTAQVRIPCADAATVQAGPAGQVGHDTARYTATVSRGDLLAGAVVRGQRCVGHDPMVPRGEARLVGISSQVLDVWSIAAGTVAPTAAASTPDVARWTDRSREVRVAAADSARIVIWHEGFNEGWRATLGNRQLTPVTIDGWRQGFVVPAGAGGTVVAHFAPDRTYRAGLLTGGALVLLALVLAAVWGRGPTRVVVAESAPGRRPRLLGAALALGAFTVIGGIGGFLIGLLAQALPRRSRMKALMVVGAALVAAGAWWPGIARDTWPTAVTQALGLGLLALAVAVHTSEDGALDQTPEDVRDEDRHAERGDRDGDERSLEQVEVQHRENPEQDR